MDKKVKQRNAKGLSENPVLLQHWLEELSLVLNGKYGITVDDCFDEKEIRSRFYSGESPGEVVQNLGAKRGLVDQNS